MEVKIMVIDSNELDMLIQTAKEKLQAFDNTTLLAIVNDQINLKNLVKEVLIYRGMSLSKGVWVGFSEANAELKYDL